ncbi:hypothetical protein GQ457_03G019740 [Hibiscus cannabinus]
MVVYVSNGEGMPCLEHLNFLHKRSYFDETGQRFRNYDKRVVYRSWTFGFDSGIPRVTISGRFCDWSGSRGLHMLVSELGYAIIGTVSEAPIAIYYHWKIPRRSVRGGGQAPEHLDEVEMEQGNEETLPPPPPIIVKLRQHVPELVPAEKDYERYT